MKMFHCLSSFPAYFQPTPGGGGDKTVQSRSQQVTNGKTIAGIHENSKSDSDYLIV